MCVYLCNFQNGADTICRISSENETWLVPTSGDVMSGLLGQAENLHFDMFTHFKLDKPPGKFIFNRHYSSVKYRVAKFKIPSVKTAPIVINNALLAPRKGSLLPKDDLVFSEGDKWRSKFDDTSPEVALDNKTFVPVNLGHDTVFTRKAFWAIPASTRLRTLSQLRWNFAVQKLMSTIGEVLSLSPSPPTSYNFAIPSNTIQFHMMEHDLFLQFINEWKCADAKDVYSCSMKLITDMQKENYLSRTEGQEIRKWFQFLDDLHYKWDKLKPTRADTISEIVIRTRDKYNVIPPKHFKDSCLEKSMVSLYRSVFQKTSFYKKFSRTVLIIEFNARLFAAVPYVNLIYRPMFRHIIYCGLTDVVKSLEDLNVDYVTYERHPGGSTFYNCLSIVMQMNLQQIEGYMLIGDDILLNPTKLINVNLEQPIFFSIRAKTLDRRYNVYSLKFCNGTLRQPTCERDGGWAWPYYYKNQVRSTNIRLKLNGRVDEITRKGLEILRYNTGGEDLFYGEICDAAYIPQTLAKRYVTMNSIFMVKRVFIEIALPTIMHSLTQVENIQYLLSRQIPYDTNRNKPWTHWEKFKFKYAYLHPAKWGPIVTKNDTKRKTFFCNDVIPFYVHYLNSLQTA